MKPGTDHPDHFYLGKIIRPHGVKGGLKIYLDVDAPESYHGLELVFVELKRTLVPYFVEQIHLEGNKANIMLQDVQTMEEAEKLAGCRLFLPLKMLPVLKGNKFYHHEVIGFLVIDTKYGPLGLIDHILDLSHNVIMVIKKDDKEILVPMNDEIIRKVDRKNRLIRIEAPEGLIEVYC
jgi:16S rRNA processing protein RimM